MKETVLEFKLLNEFFCFNAKNIEYIFELEEYNRVRGFHKSVIGMAKYNSDVMLLIDTANLYSKKKLDLSQEKSVVVLRDKSGMKYGMLVDEILRIETLERAKTSVDLSSQDVILNHYTDSERIVNEIDSLPLLKKYNIPAMASQLIKKEFSQNRELYHGRKSFFLFKIADKSYAVASIHLQEVIENSKEHFVFDSKNSHIYGAIALRNEIVQLINIGVKSDNANDILIFRDKDKRVALEVDEVYDIELLDASKIEYIKADGAVVGFYNHNSQVIAILNPLALLEEGETSQEKRKQVDNPISEKEEYLIFYMNNIRYSISMKSVRQVIETDVLSKTESAAIVASEHVKFITTWNHLAINVLMLDKLLEIECNATETETIFLEHEGKHIACIVQEIDNIVYLNREEISNLESDKETIIDGAIVYENEVIAKLNEKFLVNLG